AKTRQRERWVIYYVPKPEQDGAALQRRLQVLLQPFTASLELTPVDNLPDAPGATSLQIPRPQPNGLETGTLPLFYAQARQLGGRWSVAEDLWQVLEIEAAELLDPAVLRQALVQVMLRHDTLRLRFDRDASGCLQRFGPPAQGVSLRCVNLPSIPAATR